MLKPILASLALLGVGAAVVTAAATATAPADDRAIREAALRFLATLKPEQKAQATFDFTSEERFNWHFIPRDRKGLPFKEMSPESNAAAVDLLKTCLSRSGFTKVDTIRQLEKVLIEIEKGSGPVRDPDRYFFSVFGEPDPRKAWGWRYEGHHCSLQWTFIGGKVISSSPQFLGTNPAEVRIEHPMKGTRVLGTEEDLARKLVKSLKPDLLNEAWIDKKAPNDILTAASRTAAIQEDRGVAYGRLDSSQKTVLMNLIKEVAQVQNAAISSDRLKRLNEAGLDTIKFAWMGGLEKGDPHYFRIQGKTFLIEYDNTQNNANHVHLVWRDFKGDFGVDLLAQHYHDSDHAHGHTHQ